MRREGDAVYLEGALTLATVSALAGAVGDELRRGARLVDFRGVTEVDSAAVAFAIAWLREARAAGRTLRFENLPAAMAKLARLYAVADLIPAA